jgi:hypothetical protein
MFIVFLIISVSTVSFANQDSFTEPATPVKVVDPITGVPVATTVNGLKVDASGSVSVSGSVQSNTWDGTGSNAISSHSNALDGYITNFPATQAVSALSWPLPSGASTAAKQDTGNSSLSSIDGKLPSLTLTGSALKVDGSAVTQPVSGTFFQATQPVSGSVSVSNFPATQPVSGTVSFSSFVTGSISNNAAIGSGAAVTFTAPANAVGFILEAESANTDNIRWAVGSTATASVGMLAEPGRDSGYVPLASNISAIAISGTQSVSVQWVVR